MTIRMAWGAAMAATVVLAAATQAAELGPVQPPAPGTWTAILDYYPTNASADGVEGMAVLRCDLTEHIALRDCHLLRETPSGYGFGQAALKLAALSNGNPEISAQKQFGVIDFEFTLHPPSISPNTLEPYHLTTMPRWLARPNVEEMARTYPRAAMHRGLVGWAVLDCQAGLDFRLHACKVIKEAPLGFGFGDAALAASKLFKIAPGTRDGVTVGDVHAKIPVEWAASH